MRLDIYILFQTLFILSRAEIDEPFEQILMRNNYEGSKWYRIPAIVVADNGTIVTATDKRWYNNNDLPAKIDVVIKLSYDHGVTWSEPKTITPGMSTKVGYGDASLVKDHKTGAILCVFNGNNGYFQSTSTNQIRQYYCISHDNGETWSDMIDITRYFYGSGCTDPERSTWKGMLFTSSSTRQLRNGRIVGAGCFRKSNGSGPYVYTVYTDDLGKTWDIGDGWAVPNGDESKVLELVNGTILMSIRHPGNRWFSTSEDGGNTWKQPYVNRVDMKDPNCNGDLIRYTSVQDGFDKNRIIHTNLYSGYPTRQNLTVKISYDEGTTWPVSKVIHPEKCQYSAAAIDTDGSILVYYEDSTNNDFKMTVSRFTLEWLTDGKDKYTPPKKNF